MFAGISLSRLPNEILNMIFKDLDPKDIKALRATSTQMHAVASPHLLKTAYIALRPRTLDVFEKIADHAIFSDSVRELVFDASQFLQDHTPDSEYRSEGDGQCTHELTKSCMPDYKHLYQKQERIKSSQRFLHHYLNVVASKFRHLESFRYSNWQVICERSQSTWYLDKGPMSWDLNVDTMCLPIVPSWHNSLPQIPFDQILLSLTGCAIKHVSLDVNSFNHARLLPAHLPLSGLLSVSRDIEVPLENSKDVLTFKAAVERDDVEVMFGLPSYTMAFSSLLARFSNLQHLELFLNFKNRWKLDPQHFSRYFFIQDHHWPRLESLVLNGDMGTGTWMVTPECFMDFLGRHAGTLQHLSIKSFCLVNSSDTWVDVVERMHRALWRLKILHLAMVRDSGDPFRFVLSKIDGNEDGRLATPFTDCEYRRRHLNILEQWAVLREPYGYDSVELRTAFQEVMKGWHDSVEAFAMVESN